MTDTKIKILDVSDPFNFHKDKCPICGAPWRSIKKTIGPTGKPVRTVAFVCSCKQKTEMTQDEKISSLEARIARLEHLAEPIGLTFPVYNKHT